jgi:hypothetical protein
VSLTPGCYNDASIGRKETHASLSSLTMPRLKTSLAICIVRSMSSGVSRGKRLAITSSRIRHCRRCRPRGQRNQFCGKVGVAFLTGNPRSCRRSSNDSIDDTRARRSAPRWCPRQRSPVRILVFFRVFADEPVPVGHLHLRQRFGVYHVVLPDDLVRHENIGAVPQRRMEGASNPIEGHSSSTERWNDVPRGTMDEVSSHVRLDLPFV